MVAMGLEVAADLRVRVLVHERDGAREVAQERHVGQGRRKVRHEPGDGDAEPAALAATGERDSLGSIASWERAASTARTASTNTRR